MILELSDLDALKGAAISKFDARMAEASPEQPLDREVAELRAELEQIYRVVVLLQKNETSMETAAGIWSKMVAICDEFGRRLSALANKSGSYRAADDRILDLRNAAEERRRLHERP